MLLLALCKRGGAFSFSSLWALFSFAMITDYCKWPHDDINQLPQYLWVHSLRVHGFNVYEYTQVFSEPSLIHPRYIFCATDLPPVWDFPCPVLFIKIKTTTVSSTSAFSCALGYWASCLIHQQDRHFLQPSLYHFWVQRSLSSCLQNPMSDSVEVDFGFQDMHSSAHPVSVFIFLSGYLLLLHLLFCL